MYVPRWGGYLGPCSSRALTSWSHPVPASTRTAILMSFFRSDQGQAGWQAGRARASKLVCTLNAAGRARLVQIGGAAVLSLLLLLLPWYELARAAQVSQAELAAITNHISHLSRGIALLGRRHREWTGMQTVEAQLPHIFWRKVESGGRRAAGGPRSQMQVESIRQTRVGPRRGTVLLVLVPSPIPALARAMDLLELSKMEL